MYRRLYASRFDLISSKKLRQNVKSSEMLLTISMNDAAMHIFSILYSICFSRLDFVNETINDSDTFSIQANFF